MYSHSIKNIATIAATLGVRKAVIAPGSRNTPLTLALTAHAGITCYPITDERSAGFFALGMAQYSDEPVVLVCTSGSAVLNFAPAVVEAYYQNLPLIVLTADRPVEWIDQADGQTIRQQNIYTNYCKASFQLPTDEDHNEEFKAQFSTIPSVTSHTTLASSGQTISPNSPGGGDTAFSDRLTAQAIDLALQFPRGPVHLNVPLKEPLYTEMPVDTLAPRILRTLTTEILPSSETVSRFLLAWGGAKRRMIVVGTGKRDKALNKVLNTLAEETDTLIVAENLSNISGAGIITNPDLFFSSLTADEKKVLHPDLLITIRHSVVSKHLKTYLRTHQPAEHWQLQTELSYADTYRSLTHILPVKGEAILKLIINSNSKKRFYTSSYNQLIAAVTERVRLQSNAYFDQLLPCDIALFRELLPVIPEGWVVQLANSTPVRIAQFFESRSDLQYFCNRGTSGIDGSVATAAGSALASGLPTLLISGDLSFLYDSNGLWNANFPINLKIIVLNNDGANIFSMIGDQKVIERCQPFFDARHSVNLDALCKAYGIEYKKLELYTHSNKDAKSNVKSKLFAQSVRRALTNFMDYPGAAVLEVPTYRNVNVSTFKELYTTLSSKT